MVLRVPPARVIWHDLECGSYRADLPLWRELADEAATGDGAARVLDVGAGTGRVTLDLAVRGHRVTALDRDPELLSALAERAAGLPIETVLADAREFSLARDDYDLCIVPMQTVQLLHGPGDRGALFAQARAHLRRGGMLACAIVTSVDDFDSRAGGRGPAPERVTVGARLYMSRAVLVSPGEHSIRIERERLVLPEGRAEEEPAPTEHDLIELEVLDEQQLARELERAGLEPLASREIAETEEHSGSTVVVARA